MTGVQTCALPIYHPTPLSLRTHTAEPVPFVVADGVVEAGFPGRVFTEEVARGAGLLFTAGWELLPYFLGVRD